MKRRIGLALAAVLVSGCSLNLSPRLNVAYYDLGYERSPQEPSAPLLPFVLVVHEPAAPTWLDNRNMHYRQAYLDAAEVRHYANSQWILTPAQMIGQRLRARLAATSDRGGALPDYGIEADYWIRPTLDEFVQVFDSPSASKGAVQLRVVLLKGRRRSFVAQETFRVEIPAPTADARGGVTALEQASQTAVAAATRWVTAQLAPQPPAAPGAQPGGDAP
jgi:cholesterol transport system auxiliary component